MLPSMGPSCSVADVTDERATIWCSSQGVFGLRGSLAKLLNRPAERIHLVFAEGAGCYGHNGADDVAADAALFSRAVGRPVRVQWMRHDEHAWEPKGPAMVMQARGAVDRNGRAVAWEYDVWSPTHSTRPRGDAGETLAGQLQGLPIKVPFIGGDRNARHGYEIDNERVVIHWLADMPPRGWEHLRTRSPTSRSSTSWPRSPGPIRWISACATCAISVPSTSCEPRP